MFKTKFNNFDSSFSSDFEDYKIIKGEDGFSPEVNVIEVEDGHQVDITDKKGTVSFIVSNGMDGIDGVGIEKIYFNDNNEMIVSMTDGSIKNLGKVSADIDIEEISVNIQKGTGAGATQQIPDEVANGFAFDETKNANAVAKDSTLKGTIPYGATGDYSSAFGGKSAAIGKRSHAEGTTTIAKGNYSHAEGDNSVTIGSDSHAEGYATTAVGNQSHAEGGETQAIGPASHSEGLSTKASAESAHAEGKLTEASGINSHAEGNGSKATGESSHSEGIGNIAEGQAAHAEGNETVASGDSSHTEGQYTKAKGARSHAEGNGTEARNVNSHAEGSYSLATGPAAHAEGQLTTASGIASHAEGKSDILNTTEYSSVASILKAWGTQKFGRAAGEQAHSEGYNTVAWGAQSHSEGKETIAWGAQSHSSGYRTVAGYDYQSVFGLFNNNKEENLLEIGNGNVDNPSNAFEVLKDGSARVYAKSTDPKGVVRVEDLEDVVGDIEAALNELHTYAQNLISGGES